ncbi:MAG: guanylate kinase [Hyphomicrobiales bacterium]
MLVVSSPSGAGKTTLTSRLMAEDKMITLSVSVTTRQARPGEVDGSDYHFISTEEFTAMRSAGDLLESAQVFEHFYGTPRAPVLAELEAGRDVLFDIDWQGAQQIRAAMAEDFLSLFILPPSGRALYQRLVNRAQDSHEVIGRRMAGAAREISHWDEYDYVIINDDLDTAYQEICVVLQAGRLARHRRRAALTDHVAGLERQLRDVMET